MKFIESEFYFSLNNGYNQDVDSEEDSDSEGEGSKENFNISKEPRRSTRSTAGKPPERFTYLAYPVLIQGGEPSSYEEAIGGGADSILWKVSMQEEYDALIRNGTWKLVPKPENRKVVGCKWIYKIKRNSDGTVERYKSRLVARGFSQIEGLDYEETYAPVVSYPSVRFVLSLAAKRGWLIQQVDVRNAYLNGDLDCTLYMEQPKGFVSKQASQHVCLLLKGIYGLKQAGKIWNEKLNHRLLELGFSRLQSDLGIYIYRTAEGNIVIYLVLYQYQWYMWMMYSSLVTIAKKRISYLVYLSSQILK